MYIGNKIRKSKIIEKTNGIVQYFSSKISYKLQYCLKEINLKIFLKPILLMFSIYTLSMLSIIRANFMYVDDMGRTMQRYRNWDEFGRYVSNFLSLFIHAGHINDISPLPQLLAVAIVSISSVLMIYVLCNKKITTATLIASIPIGISPYFLECLSYKFDSPYMALSVFASIVPFLFVSSTAIFITISIISLLIMLMTYQASSGIYILLTIILAFQNWNYKKHNNYVILKFLLLSVFSYILALILYRVLFMKTFDAGYVSTSIFPQAQILQGTIMNFKKYIVTILYDFTPIWKNLIILICSCFIFFATYTSKQNKKISFIISLVVLFACLIFSYGIYIILEKPLFAARALYGFGIFIAVVGILVVAHKKLIAQLLVFTLSWTFFVFSFTYGNALSEQKRYIEFRHEILLNDLNNLLPNINKDTFKIQIEGTASLAPAIIDNISKRYPVIKRLVPCHLAHYWWWGTYYLLSYYNWGGLKMLTLKESSDFSKLDLPVIFDSYYHTINYSDNKIFVQLKNH